MYKANKKHKVDLSIQKSKKIPHILYVNGGLMDYGGISSFMLNYYSHFDLERIHIDFLVHGDIKKGNRDCEILSRGGKIYYVVPRRINPVKNYRQIYRVIQEGNYDIVHANADSGNAHILEIAEKCGVSVRISHCHNADYTINNRFRIAFNDFQRKKIHKYATHFWACSEKAGIWLYGKKEVFEIIPNAIDVKKFEFSPQKRELLREKYGLNDKFVIGHIGKFDYQKNQEFLIEILDNVVKIKPDTTLVFIGDGVNREIIENQTEESGIKSNILFLGQQRDIASLINIFDLFVLPSRYEGLPIVAIEAQSNGLKCICSNAISKEVNVTGNVEFLDLKDKDAWVQSMCRVYKRYPESIMAVERTGYEIELAAKKLQEIYLNMICS